MDRVQAMIFDLQNTASNDSWGQIAIYDTDLNPPDSPRDPCLQGYREEKIPANLQN